MDVLERYVSGGLAYLGAGVVLPREPELSGL